MKLPCENCILIPICRHKGYSKLIKECSLLLSEIYIENCNVLSVPTRKDKTDKNLIYLFNLLKPTRWFLTLSKKRRRYLIKSFSGYWRKNEMPMR